MLAAPWPRARSAPVATARRGVGALPPMRHAGRPPMRPRRARETRIGRECPEHSGGDTPPSRCRGKRESGKKGSTPDTGRAPLLAVLAAHDGVCHTLSQCAPAQPCRTGAPRPPRVPAPREKGVLCCERREQQQQRSANVQRQVRPVDAHRGERVCGWAQHHAAACTAYAARERGSRQRASRHGLASPRPLLLWGAPGPH